MITNHLIEDHEAPFLTFDPLHQPFSLVGTFAGKGDHRISGNANTCARTGAITRIGGEAQNLTIFRR